jgi:hypothetical protein
MPSSTSRAEVRGRPVRPYARSPVWGPGVHHLGAAAPASADRWPRSSPPRLLWRCRSRPCLRRHRRSRSLQCWAVPQFGKGAPVRNNLSECGHHTCIVEPTGHHADDGRLLECGLRLPFSSAEEVGHRAPRRLAVLSPAVHGGGGNGGPPVRCDLVEYRLDYRSFGKNCIVWQGRYRSERSASRIGHLHEHLQMGHSPRRVHRHRRQHNVLCVVCYRGVTERTLVDTCAAVRRQGIGDVARCAGRGRWAGGARPSRRRAPAGARRRGRTPAR